MLKKLVNGYNISYSDVELLNSVIDNITTLIVVDDEGQVPVYTFKQGNDYRHVGIYNHKIEFNYVL